MRFSTVLRIVFGVVLFVALIATADVSSLFHQGVQFDVPNDPNGYEHDGGIATAAQPIALPQNNGVESKSKSDAEKIKHTYTTGPEPLNELIVEHYINTMEWAYDMKLTTAEKEIVLKHLIGDWNAGGSNMLTSPVIMNDVNFSLISVYRTQSADVEQEKVRQNTLNALLQLPDQPNPDSFGMQILKMYQAHHASVPPESASASSTLPQTSASVARSDASRGKLPEGMLNGVYASFHKRSYSLGFDPRFLVFYPNGTVIYLPENGLAGFDLNAYVNDPRTDKALVGRYRGYGNYISVVWNDNPGHRDQFGHNESGGLGGYDSFSPSAPPNGLRLSGVYYWGQPNGIQFNADGTFFDQRAMDTLILPNPHFNNPRAMGGTYVIQDYTIVLNYRDGSRAVTSFIAPAHQRHGQAFDWIAMHGSILYGQGYQPQP